MSWDITRAAKKLLVGGGGSNPPPEVGKVLFAVAPQNVAGAYSRLIYIRSSSGHRVAHLEFGQDRCVSCRFGAGPRRPKCLYLKDLPKFVLQFCSCRD